MMSKGVSEQGGEKGREKKCSVHVGFIDLEKAYDRVNREALWQVMRMYDVGGKLLNCIKTMYVSSLACDKVNGGERVSCPLGSSMYIWTL